MAFVPVPKDLTRVKSKILFHLTLRQLVCFSAGAAVSVPVYLLAKGSIGTTYASILMILILLPFLAFALYEKDGMPLEEVIRIMIRQKWMLPGVRPYQTRNLYEILQKSEENGEEDIVEGKEKREDR